MFTKILGLNLPKKESLDTLYYTIGNVFSTLITFITLPIITRIISPEQLSIFNYTNAIKGFLLTITCLSLNSFLLRHYFKLKTESERKKLFGTVFYFLFLFSTALLFAELAVFPIIIDHFSIQVAFDPFFKIMLFNNYFEVAAIIPLVIYRVRKKPVAYLLLTLSKSILMIALGLLFIIFFDKGIMGRYLGILLPNIFFILIYLIILRNKISFGIDFAILKKGLKYSLPIIPAAFAATAMSSADKIMIERFLDIKYISIYSIGFSIGSIILIMIRGFYLAIEPIIFENYDKKNFSKLIINYKVIFLLIINLVGCSVIIFSNEIVSIFVSFEYSESRLIIPFIVTSCIFRGAQIVVDTTLYAQEKTIYHPIITGFGLLINILGNIILLPIIGMVGAAISSLISFWVLYMLSVYVTKKFININWLSFRITTSIMLSCFLSSICSYIFFYNGLFTVAIKTICLLSLSLITLYLLKKVNIIHN